MSLATGLHRQSAQTSQWCTASAYRNTHAASPATASRPQPCHQRPRPVQRLQATSTEQESGEKESVPPTESEPVSRPSTSSQQQASGEVDLAKQLQRLRSDKQPAQASGLLQGIVEETQLIEWPKPLQAVKDTFLVIAILAGTTVFLFGANTVLAEALALFLQRG